MVNTTFPVPTVNDTRDVLSIFQFVNDKAVDGLFFPITMLALWVIAFIGSISEGRSAPRAMIFASFIFVVLGMMLAVLNFLQMTYVYFAVLLIAFGIFWIRLFKSPNN